MPPQPVHLMIFWGTENTQINPGLVGRDMSFIVVLPGGTITFVSLSLTRAFPEVPTYPSWIIGIILVSQVLALSPARTTNIKPSIRPPPRCSRSPHGPCAPRTSQCYPDSLPQRQLWTVPAGPGMRLGAHFWGITPN